MMMKKIVGRCGSPSSEPSLARSVMWRLMITVHFLAVGSSSVKSQTQVEEFYKEAQDARARGDLAQAEHKYQEVICRAPQLANAYHNLGIVYFMERKYSEAVTTLQTAIKLNPQRHESQVMLGLAHYELYEPEKAAVAFRSALRLNPPDTNALLYLGKSQLQMREYRTAAKTFEKLAEAKPSDPDVLYNLGVSYMKLMIETSNRLGEVAPRSYQSWLLLAQDAEARNEDATAIKYYLTALRVKPDGVGIHYALGSVYARTDEYNEAVGEFKKELGINPNDSLALWKLGELMLRTNPAEARSYLEPAVRLNPDLPQAVLAYGRALARMGEIEKAIEQFHRVVILAPEEDSVHYHLANAYRRLGRDEDSKTEIVRFEELAKKKSARTQETARQLIELSRTAQETTDEPEAGFSPERDPTHH